MINFVPFKCPVCQQALAVSGRSYACPQAHSYDLARQGYLNLLVAQQRRSKQPGDSDEMVLSRQRFLDQGSYQSLASAIAEIVGSHRSGFAQSLLDMGCGEGYYLQQLRAAANLQGQNSDFQIAGVDISKRAVREAAKRKLYLQLAVGTTAALPFFDQSFDSLLCVFSPLSASEALRLLKPGGQVHILEFSHVGPKPLARAYDLWSFQVLPRLGQAVAHDRDSYQYLAESIRKFPDQQALVDMLTDAGFERVRYENLSSGIAAIHRGVRV